jgi:N-acetylglutamate synthase-like GNAT family acetyltransferase
MHLERDAAGFTHVQGDAGMTGFTFRRAEDADFEAVLALSIRAMRVHLERIGRYDPERRRARMRRQFDAGILQVIEQDGILAGCIGVEDKGGWVEIHSLFLDDHAQGRGLGAAVWRAVLAAHPGRVFRLEVLKQSPARRFWERHGFTQIDDLPFDWLMQRLPD